jgi:hypothetical protein
MSAPAAGSETAPTSFRRRRVGRFSSKSPNRPEPRSELGSLRSRPGMDGTSSQAAFRRSRTYRPGSMRGSSTPGSRVPGSTARPMARIRCGERRRLRFTRRRATCEPSNCSLGTRSSKARSAISGSRSMTRSTSRSRSSCGLITGVAARARYGPEILSGEGSRHTRQRPLPPQDAPFGITVANREVKVDNGPCRKASGRRGCAESRHAAPVIQPMRRPAAARLHRHGMQIG